MSKISRLFIALLIIGFVIYASVPREADFWIYAWSKGNLHYYADKSDQRRIHSVDRAFPLFSKRVTSYGMASNITGNSSWLFYLTGNTVGKVRYNGREEVVMSGLKALSFDVSEDSIYVLDLKTRALIKTDLSGGNQTVLVSGECWDVQVNESLIYFSTTGISNGLSAGVYSIRPDGSELRWLLSLHDFVAYRDKIYYIDQTQKHSIWVYSLASGESVRIANSEGSMDLVAKGEWIYFRNSFTSQIYRLKTDNLAVESIR